MSNKKNYTVKIRLTEEEVKELDIRVKESSSPDRSSYIRTRIFSENPTNLSPLDRAEAFHCLNNIRNRYPTDKETLSELDYVYNAFTGGTSHGYDKGC